MAIKANREGVEMITRTLSIAVLPHAQPIFCEACTTISIDDEAAGEYVIVRQETDRDGENKISIDPDEWPMIRGAVDAMFADIKMHKDAGQ